jgi:hypothetical protein
MVVAVIALIVAACWPAISGPLGYGGTSMVPGAMPASAAPTAPATVSTPAQPAPSLTPASTWPPRPVALDAPSVIHATGAALSWPPYGNVTGDPGNDLAAYEVHRGTRPGFTPSPATLVATLNADRTSFTDTTAPASGAPHAGDYYYMVAVRTKSGKLISGTTRFVQLPGPGQSELVVPADAAATINSRYPDTMVDTSEYSLSAGPDTGQGADRAIIEFAPLTAIPSGAAVAGARLRVWCAGSDAGPIVVYAMTRTFYAQEATWNTAGDGVAWARPGGDYTTPSGAALPIDTADPDVCEFDATAIARGWASPRGAEHALLLKARNEAASSGHGSFSAGDTYFPQRRPQLIVTYAPRA